MPFWKASAGHILTKVLRILVSYWKGEGHKVIMYLDDGIGGHSKYRKARVLSQYLQKSLPELGLLIACDQCLWELVFRLEWLGYCLDMSVARIYVMDERIKRLEAAIYLLLYQIRVHLSSKDTSETGRIRTQSPIRTSKGKTNKEVV